MRRVILTDASVRSLICPADKGEEIFWDRDVPGFGLRVRRTGGRAWMIKYNTLSGRTQKVTIGPLHLFTLRQARDQAKNLLADVRRGADPAAHKRNKRALAEETLGVLAPRFLAFKKPTLKPHTLASYRRGLAYFKPLHQLPVTEIDRRAIAKQTSVLAETHGRPAADAARSALSSFFMWAAANGFADTNPVAFTAVMSETKARERVVSDEELRRIWAACVDTDYCTVVKLLILTGARFQEIGGLRWSEVDFDQALISLPAARVKIGRPHLVPLPPSALAILEEEHKRRAISLETRDGLVFGHYSKTGLTNASLHKTRLDNRIAEISGPILPWTHHDFRRSMSTTMHERLDIQPHIVEACLGHMGGHRAGIAGTYNRSVYLDERRRALNRWADHVMSVVAR
jgi:integrase